MDKMNFFIRLKKAGFQSIDLAAVTLMTLAWYFIAKYMFMSDLHPNGDNYQYLHLMQSMWDGNGYSTSYGGEIEPSNWFPPGYPSLLFLERLLFGNDVIAFKWMNLTFLLGTVLLVWSWLKKWLNDRALPLTICLVLLLNAGLWHFGAQLMSEIPFMFFTILALRSYHQLHEKQDFWKSYHFYLLLFGVGCAYYLRGIGITIPAAFVVHSLMRKQWKFAGAVFFAFVLISAPLKIRNNVHGFEGRYAGAVLKKNIWNPDEGQLTTVSDWTEKFKKNAYDTVFRGFLEVTVPYAYSKKPETSVWLLGGLWILLIAFGLFRLGSTGHMLIIFLAGNAAVMLMWHGGNYSRYVWPLAPILTLGLFNGIIAIIRWMSEKMNVHFSSSFVFILLGIGAFTRPHLDLYHKTAQNPMNSGMKKYLALADSVQNDTLENPLVVCRKPLIFHENSGARTKRFPLTSDSLVMLKFLVETSPDYIVLDNMGYNSAHKYLTPFLNANRDIWYLDTDAGDHIFLLRFRGEKGRLKLAAWNQKMNEANELATAVREED